MIGSTAKMISSLLDNTKETNSTVLNANTQPNPNPSCNPNLVSDPKPDELENLLRNMMSSTYSKDNTPLG